MLGGQAGQREITGQAGQREITSNLLTNLYKWIAEHLEGLLRAPKDRKL